MAKQIKVLYVDDEPLLKMAFVEGLKRHGYDISGSDGGESVLDMIRDEKPDLLILDLMMKPLDGWSILSVVKDYPDFENMSVIMQTGKSLTLHDFFKYGDYIDNYLVKPFRIQNMIEVIEQIEAQNAEIAHDIERATEMGIDKDSIKKYVQTKRKAKASIHLLEALSRLYPITKDGTITSMGESATELTEIATKHAACQKEFNDIKSEIFG
jgi:DNA-binding response OmpR family regulator